MSVTCPAGHIHDNHQMAEHLGCKMSLEEIQNQGPQPSRPPTSGPNDRQGSEPMETCSTEGCGYTKFVNLPCAHCYRNSSQSPSKLERIPDEGIVNAYIGNDRKRIKRVGLGLHDRPIADAQLTHSQIQYGAVVKHLREQHKCDCDLV